MQNAEGRCGKLMKSTEREASQNVAAVAALLETKYKKKRVKIRGG